MSFWNWDWTLSYFRTNLIYLTVSVHHDLKKYQSKRTYPNLFKYYFFFISSRFRFSLFYFNLPGYYCLIRLIFLFLVILCFTFLIGFTYMNYSILLLLLDVFCIRIICLLILSVKKNYMICFFCSLSLHYF